MAMSVHRLRTTVWETIGLIFANLGDGGARRTGVGDLGKVCNKSQSQITHCKKRPVQNGELKVSRLHPCSFS